MGEPLNNYTALVEAIRVMTASPFHLSPKKITVSTVSTPLVCSALNIKHTHNVLSYHSFRSIMIIF